MKSLKPINVNEFTLTHEYFNDDIIKHILIEGFEPSYNDSYCNFKEHSSRCYTKHIEENKSITCYIFETGIGIDCDFECGGNLHSHFFSFNDYSFEEAYDEMVDLVNNYIK